LNTTYAHITEKFPAVKRLDSQNWARWKFWPGAMTVFLPRVFIIFLCNFMLWPISSLILIQQPDDEPIVGARKSCLVFWYKFASRA
jgi:hypothetical protein